MQYTSYTVLNALAGLLLAATLLVAARPAAAQQDERFFGRWVHNGRDVVGFVTYVDATEGGGILSGRTTDDFYVVERYEVVRDFGDRVVVRVWGLVDEWYSTPASTIAVMSLGEPFEFKQSRYQNLYIEFCDSPKANAFFLQDFDPDQIWQRMQEWAASTGDEYPEDQCHYWDIGPDWKEGYAPDGWVGSYHERRIDALVENVPD